MSIMDVGLRVQDVRDTVLNFEPPSGKRLASLREFFLLFRYPRRFTAPSILASCSFYDLYIDYRFGSVPGRPGPPHPGMFADFFPKLVGRLVGSENTLTLFVKSVDPSYFDELDTIRQFLGPRCLRYILIADAVLGATPMSEPDPGLLFFEWPLELLEHVVKHWFMCPQVSIEGYIARVPPLTRISELCFQPDSEAAVRSLLHEIEIGFRVWTDNNGLFLLTDKHRAEDIKERLDLPSLDQAIQEAARRYDAGG